MRRSITPRSVPVAVIALALAALGSALIPASPCRAQVAPGVPAVINNVSGVYVDPDGALHQRQVDDKNDLAAQRLRAKALAQSVKPGELTYVSLARLFDELRSHADANRDLPDSLRYLSGLTQLRYVFVFPDAHDVVIAGASEPFEVTNRLQPTGKVTGRPVLHLDDLVTALRVAGAGRGAPRAFGCSLDPHPDAMNRTNQVMRDLASASRAARMDGLREAVGPQQVRTFGLPADSRTVFVTIAADYKLKRFFLGLDPIPVAGVGLPVDNTRAAGNRFWFELDYAPLLTAPGGDAFELRGQRLTLKAGAFSFDEKGATETSKRFARNFAAKMPQLATAVPLFADLQNLADLAVVAALIRRDRLDEKAGLDLAWILSESNYRPARVPTPRTADTLVNYANGSLVAGGVTFNPAAVVAQANREADRSGALAAARQQPGSDNWWKTQPLREPAAKPK